MPWAVILSDRQNPRRAADTGRCRTLPRHPSNHGATAATEPEKRAELSGELAETRSAVRAEMLSALGAEFDAIHSIQRAVEVGSVDAVITAAHLRPAIAEHIDDWMQNGQPG